MSELVHAALLPALRLELLPKASIEVFVTVLEADAPEEGTVAAAVTAASTALAQAGIEMYGLVAGVAGLFVTPTQEQVTSPQALFLTDSTAVEAESPSVRGVLQLSAMPALGGVTSLRQLISHGTEYEVIDAVCLAYLISLLLQTCTDFDVCLGGGKAYGQSRRSTLCHGGCAVQAFRWAIIFGLLSHCLKGKDNCRLKMYERPRSYHDSSPIASEMSCSV